MKSCYIACEPLALIFIVWSSILASAQTILPLEERDNKILKSDSGIDLCFLPTETVVGAQIHIINDYVARGTPVKGFSGPRTSRITVSDTGEPIVLILRSSIKMVWDLDIAPDANVVGVHLITDILPQIEGLSSHIPLTARYTVEETKAQNICVFQPVEDPTLIGDGPEELRAPKHSFNELQGLIELNNLEDELIAYSGTGITSFQVTEGDWSGGVAIVSKASTQAFDETKATGESLLDQISPPELPLLDENVATLRVPEGLGRGKVWPWIVAEGYAIPIPADLIKHFCEVDRLIVMSSGVEVFNPECRWGNYEWPDSWSGMLLLGPVEMSHETCRMAGQPRPLLSKPGVGVTTEKQNCTMYTIDINRKTYR